MANQTNTLPGHEGLFSGFGKALAKGDLFVKLSLLWWGAGYVRRKQYVKAVIMTLLEAAIIWFTVSFAMELYRNLLHLGQSRQKKSLM